MPTYPPPHCQYHERNAVKYTAPYADRRLIFSISYIDLHFCDFLSWLLRGTVCSALFSARIVQVVYPWCTVSLWVSPIFLKDRQVFAHFSPIDIWRAIKRARIIIPLISVVRGVTSAWIWQLQADCPKASPQPWTIFMRTKMICVQTSFVFFSFFPMPLIPLKYPAAQSFHQPANRMTPQKRGVPNKTTLPRSAVVRH